ncbi:MAG: DUF3100 domain-containing protein [Castellaniella sp.]|uniref:DUF3100 domain-containing protein n=1 Tax=Castellaniella sp. TaxID=1955812 RepID=UPI003C714531
MNSAHDVHAQPGLSGARLILVAGVFALALSISAQLIGTYQIKLGSSAIVLFPIIWVVLLAGVVSTQRIKPLPRAIQDISMSLMMIGITIFLTRLGMLIGPSLDEIRKAGAAILLQEVGHILGTVIFALPVGVALGLGRAAIGATFSIDREPQLGYMLERYGGGSAEYSGTFAVWLLGSVFGALYISLLAGVLASTGLFKPLALALGAGVGSASMMAGAAAALSVVYPELKDQIFVYAGLSNLVTNIVGIYAGYYVALPLAERLYGFWSKALRRGPDAADGVVSSASHLDASPLIQLKGIGQAALALAVIGVAALISNWVGPKSYAAGDVVGMLILCGVTALSLTLRRIVPQVPAVIWALTIGVILSTSYLPFGPTVVQWVGHLDLISVGVPALGFVGLSLGRDFALLRRLSWRVVVVALVTFTATYVAAAAIAQFLVEG